MPLTNVFKKVWDEITPLRSIPKKKLTVCNAVYFPFCIDLMHITPPVTAERYDGFHHPRYAECIDHMTESSSMATSLLQARFDVFMESTGL